MHRLVIFLFLLASAISFGQSWQLSKNTAAESRSMLLMQAATDYYADGYRQKGKAALLEIFNYCAARKDLAGELRSFMAMGRYSIKDETLFSELVTAQEKLVKQYKNKVAGKAIRYAQDSVTNFMLNTVLQLYKNSSIDLSLKFCAQVIEFRKFSDPTDIRPYDMMTLFSIYKGDLNKAFFYGLKAVSIQENSGITKLSERPYDNLGKAYAEIGNNDLALKYYQRAISILREKDTLVYGEILKNTTQLLLRLGKPEQALLVVNENITSRNFDDPYERATIKEIYGNCYFVLGQYDAAEKNYLERYSEVTRLNDKVELLIASVPLAKLYIKIGEYKKAVFYLTQLDNDTTKGWVPISVQRDVQSMFYQADSASGNYLSALAHIKLYKLLNDSIFSTTKNRQIEELKVQYETVKKDQRIQLLKKQGVVQTAKLQEEQLQHEIENQNKKQQLEVLAYEAEKKDKDIKLKEQHIQLLINQGELKNAALQRTLFIRDVSLAGAILLVVLLLLVYRGYRVKRKNNINLQKQKEIIRQNNLDLHLLNYQQHKLLAEKEWLIKEVHHRVKNNMQIIISLLNAQAEFLENPFALSAIMESRERMQAMALIHKRLYLSNEDTLINMRSYVREMVDYLDSGFSNAGNISFQIDVDDIGLDIAQVVPLGLIINEAITNAVKYAFPDGRSGSIRIELLRRTDDHISMNISDNGVGSPKGSAIGDSNSFGIQLMRLFAEQLEGELSFETDRGLSISLIFKEQQRTDKVSYLLNRQPQYGEDIDR
jgi:two-component system, sensor histidine kinase PdtaS